ncbi:MAG: acyltransferase [Azonexus sp.]|jgi:peptidoglycan/LPS O-acetylase OafA/YrhL|nr:acyltransferase [Azonexus sp.]
MNKSFSVYLDLVRFLAACLVYLYHSNQRLLVGEILPASHFGHSAVIVFFVLSGFVIAYVTDTKEKTWTSYAASRLSRIYSVAAPAILLTLILDSVGRNLYPALYADYPYDQFLIRAIGSFFFANEVWFVSITSFSNVPYWSICYEIWYYAAFGILMFLPRKIAIILLLLLAAVLGPKIALLAPIWGMGVALYHWQAPKRLSVPVAWCLFWATVVAIVLFHSYGVSPLFTEWLKTQMGTDLHHQFTFSKFFPADYILGILVTANFAAMRRVAGQIAPLMQFIERPVKTLASYTFTLYLLHQPLFLFWAAVLHGNPSGYGYWLATTVLMAISVGLIGYFTENRRRRLCQGIESALCRIAGRLSAGYDKA